MYLLFTRKGLRFKWINKIMEIIVNSGWQYLWESQLAGSIPSLKNLIWNKSTDLFIQNWYSEIQLSSQCINYRIIKNTQKFETYLVKLPDNLRISFTKFRCPNNKLPIEYGIYARVDRNHRLWTHCDKLCDKFHYLFKCVKFQDKRKLFFKKILYQKTHHV